MTGYEAFGLYESLKIHFSKDSYDFFKYNGKTNVSVNTFENRRDKYHFYKLSRKYQQKDDLVAFIVANLLEKDNLWVGDLLNESAEVNYRKHQKTIQSLSYEFANDLAKVFDGISDPNEVIQVIDGEYPKLLTMLNRKEISIETVVLLNKILGFLPMWERKVTDTIVAPNQFKRIRKYASFLQQDIVKYKLILKKTLGV